MTTYGDFFTGFGGMTIGAKAAGLKVRFGVEYDPDLAAVYRRNLGDHIVVADVTDLDVTTLPRVDVFHASPPCTRASVANANAEESPLDLAMAQATCRYIAHHLPDVVTLENVYQYRNFESWRVIVRTLLEHGYTYNYWHVNMADYGVPQTRKRMIVIARRDGGAIELPEKTHAENPTPGLFGTKARWVSWYEAIEDLIPTLKPGQLAPFQTRKELPKVCMVDGNNSRPDTGQATIASKGKPSFTITANGKGTHRFVIDGNILLSTPRALARFQSFPDWYALPESSRLAAKGIGNAVPPLFAQRLYGKLTI